MQLNLSPVLHINKDVCLTIVAPDLSYSEDEEMRLTFLILPFFYSTLAVRITDEIYRHPECYTCTDCGLNLRMRGHFWFGDEMYCEKHANHRHQNQGSNPQATVSPRY